MQKPITLPNADTLPDAPDREQPAAPEAFAQDIGAILGLAATDRILRAATAVSGLRFVAIARVTSGRWVTCASLDGLGFGLGPGDELKVETTLCHEVWSSRTLIVIDDVECDPVYNDHHTPRQYGFRSYISVPIVDGEGRFFGTLCGLDVEPRGLSTPAVIETFILFADLVAAQLDAQREIARQRRTISTQRSFGRQREEFVASLGHDLRNPVAAILAGTRLIERQDPDTTVLEIAGHIRASAERMDRLVQNLLDLARARLGGGIPIERTPDADLAAEFRNIVAEIEAVSDCEIRTTFDLGPIDCDRARMGQVLSNLLGNAVLHGTPGEPVDVEAGCRDGAFRLAVTNVGATIDDDARRWIFLPFRRGTADTDRQGLGLGLYIASRIARAHGGDLTFENGNGRVTFIMTMPC